MSSTSLPPWHWLDDPARVYLTNDRVLHVDGSGGRGWLSSLLTADLRSAAPGAGHYALLLTPTGGIVSDAWVVDCGLEKSERLSLVLPVASAERVCKTLEKYLLNEKVTLSFDDALRVVAVHGRRAREIVVGPVATFGSYSCARLGRAAVDIWVPASEVDGTVTRISAAAHELGGGAVGALDWTSARVALGIPATGVDFDDTLSPHEAGLDGRAVSFAKGCYLGQERVARQKRHGGLPRRLVQLAIEGVSDLAEGSSVLDLAGNEVGRVTSIARASDGYGSVLALACLTSPFAEVGTRLVVVGRAAQVRLVVGQSDQLPPPVAGQSPAK